jgi:uracil-DNA glycosylase
MSANPTTLPPADELGAENAQEPLISDAAQDLADRLWRDLPVAWRDGFGPDAQAAQGAILRASERAVADQKQGGIYPPHPRQWLAAFKAIPQGPAGVKVALVGQDPYHGPNQAMGLCFSVPEREPSPPSLRNILAELKSDLGLGAPSSGDLTAWARRGVLLLNASLTVRPGQANSHAFIGWDELTQLALAACARDVSPKVFVGWGSFAQKKILNALASPEARVWPTLFSAHPSPLSAHRGFLGSRPFSAINGLLGQMGAEPVDWRLPGQ